jgi:ribosomal protein S18 acetylase RimI-like enzyme
LSVTRPGEDRHQDAGREERKSHPLFGRTASALCCSVIFHHGLSKPDWTQIEEEAQSQKLHQPIPASMDHFPTHIQIRLVDLDDVPFLEEMLFEAFHWDPSQPRPGQDEFLADPKVHKYLSGWGRRGDAGVVAIDGKEPVGAGWIRQWTEADQSYGFVDEEIPELGLAVREAYRSKGIGRMLLRRLVVETAQSGYKALSLSVEPSNFAIRLYESEGFVKVSESGMSWTLMRAL